jgi:hypothetical protein
LAGLILDSPAAIKPKKEIGGVDFREC